jgi:hypothetical protein
MPPPNDYRWPRPRWTTLVALVAACAMGVVGSWLLQRPPVERLANQWGQAIASQDEAQAIASIVRLTEFGEAAIPWWAEVLTDPRDEVVHAAGAALERETDRWQSLDENAVADRWARLIDEIHCRRSRFTPTAWTQVAMIVRRGVSATHGMHSTRRMPFLVATESLLREAPLHAAPTKVSENIAETEPMVTPSGEAAALMALSAPVTKRSTTDETYAKSQPPPAYTARLDRRAPKILNQNAAEEFPRESKASGSTTIASGNDSSASKLGTWSEVELMKALQSSDRYVAASVAKELKKRGYQDVHINAAERLFDADPLERRKLVDEIPSIKGIDPRLWLEQLARDENESVRTAAEATLRTATRVKGRKGRSNSQESPR